MRSVLPLMIFSFLPAWAQLKTGPPLPYHAVEGWAKLPAGWNFGETSGVDIDRNDNVWVFNRGAHPVMQFDKSGRMLQAWNDVPAKSSHGSRVDADGNIWTVDVAGHRLMKFTPAGALLMFIGSVGGAAGNNDSKDAFNRPTGITFAPNGDLFVSDGYENSRVIKFNKDGDYLTHWGTKGTGDGQFNLVHDVALDKQGRLYVADRTNNRVQIFDVNGRFLGKWTDLGSPWGLYYVARENVLYMCDGVNDRILKLNLDGQVLGVLGSHGKIAGKLDFPHNLAVDSTGAIYVAEIKNWRVQKFIPNK
ncbi:MAG: peptidyl-alpha-hydroxyglycine alpha-amidating lyase family protein [Acidobacteriota bacterium]|nr:peptidyl-alpha-hydroxyglycine alpha-amidating lyase family protein [Acidobacteriota bacterium]